ncbi:hypothetical protein HYQ46_001361 [Verticillium longisporum]|nr:hypothetical protein HYQ44_009375 [Verticillium longisporum]KAG7149721.1 hypothetical protein HYQ46_001361 [Verticillium longisporum]
MPCCFAVAAHVRGGVWKCRFEAKLTRWSNDLTILFDSESRLIFSEFSFRLDSPSTEHLKRILTSNAASPFAPCFISQEDYLAAPV